MIKLRFLRGFNNARPRGAHRYEAFSLKLSRRLTLYTRPSLEPWIVLEANPAVVTFCERPRYVQFDGHQLLADFWVRYVDRQDVVVLYDSRVDDEISDASRALDGKALTIRRVAAGELIAARVWDRQLAGHAAVPHCEPEARVAVLIETD